MAPERTAMLDMGHATDLIFQGGTATGVVAFLLQRWYSNFLHRAWQGERRERIEAQKALLTNTQVLERFSVALHEFNVVISRINDNAHVDGKSR